MAPCTTTGTTWETCGHSIYQHQPTCNHRGKSCTKNSLLQPGICPSCTQGDFYPPPEPPRLPDHLNRSEASNPVKIKNEPVNENDMVLVKEEPPHPDLWLRSEHAKLTKELAEKSGNFYNGEGGASSGLFGRCIPQHTGSRKVFCRNCGADGHQSQECPPPKDMRPLPCSNCQDMGHTKVCCPKRVTGVGDSGVFDGEVKEENGKDTQVGGGRNGLFRAIIKNDKAGIGASGTFDDVAKEAQGKEYFLQFHIKQLEEKIEAARLREAENNVKIGNLQAQVGLLRDPQNERSYAVSVSTRGTSRSGSHACMDVPIAPPAQQGNIEVSPAKPMIDVREQIRGNRIQVNNGFQVAGSQNQDYTHGGTAVNEGERGGKLQSVNHQQVPSPLSNGPRVKKADKIPPLKEVVANEHGEEKGAPIQQHAMAQSNGQAPTNGTQSSAPKVPIALPVEPHLALQVADTVTSANRKQLFDIAAISFSSQLAIKLINLKDALNIQTFDHWFDAQVAHSFKCAKELNFHNMLGGYKDFIDWVGVQLEGAHQAKLEEESIKSALKESEKMVQVLMDVEAIIATSE